MRVARPARMHANNWLTRLALVGLLGLGGCYRATFFPNPNLAQGETHERWSDFFVFGLVGHEQFDTREFCPNQEVTMVRTGGNFATGLVSALTIGIYTPRKVYISCAPARGSAERSLEIEADEAGRPIRAVLHNDAGERELAIQVLSPEVFLFHQPGGST